MKITSVFLFSTLVFGILAPEQSTWANAEIGTVITSQKRMASALEKTRPVWAFQLDGSAETLGGALLSHPQEFQASPAMELRVGYQPAFLQPVGVFSFGSSFSFFPVSSAKGGLLRTPSSWALGGEARYQLKLFRGQWLVPTAALGAEYLAYQLASGASGRVLVRTPSVGLLFLLNAVDPTISRDFFLGYGAQRTYLLAELRRSEGNDTKITFSGNSLFFGLRIEY